MKKWTVMLIPHDRGSTRTLRLNVSQLWLVCAVITGVSFCGSYFYGRHMAFNTLAERQRHMARDPEQVKASPVSAPAPTGLSPQERLEVENRLRSEYETSISAITSELGELYELDKQARSLTGIAPRTQAKRGMSAQLPGGKGGGGSRLSDVAYEQEREMAGPPSAIYGMAHPSADLVIQEINLRTDSLRSLVNDVHEKARKEVVGRVPAIWPAVCARQEISSRFGYRKDPFNLRISHHDGLDIMANYGAPVVATAKGVVLFSGWDGEMGNIVKIRHGNGMETWYAHMSTRTVNEGQEVDRRTVIGKVGSTGRSTGAHLHYEVHVNGQPVDPGKYVRN
jgi:murein DD-endopeptidase MepM/ murein hydrolase activator NlpD